MRFEPYFFNPILVGIDRGAQNLTKPDIASRTQAEEGTEVYKTLQEKDCLLCAPVMESETAMNFSKITALLARLEANAHEHATKADQVKAGTHRWHNGDVWKVPKGVTLGKVAWATRAVSL